LVECLRKREGTVRVSMARDAHTGTVR
jgi:hypothetical protein